MTKCRICNLEYGNIGKHLKHQHPGVSVVNYYDTFLKQSVKEGVCHYEDCIQPTRFISCKKGYCMFCNKIHAQLSNMTREKIKKTKIERYGDENFFNRAKIRQTKLERYGDEKYNNRPKSSKTLLSRSKDDINKWMQQVQSTWKQKTTQDKQDLFIKRKDACIRKYGVTPYEMMRRGIFEKYGVYNISQVPEVVKIRGENISKTWRDNKIDIVRKVQNTNLQKYGYKHIMVSPLKDSIIFKSHEARVRLGQILPSHLIPEYQRYKNKVYALTKKNAVEKFTVEELGRIGLCGVEGALQVDHIFTVKDGFLNNIPYNIIASKCNIQLVSWLENDTKKSVSDITKEMLLALYSEECDK